MYMNFNMTSFSNTLYQFSLICIYIYHLLTYDTLLVMLYNCSV